MSVKKKRLGRGLGSLIGDIDSAVSEPAQSDKLIADG